MQDNDRQFHRELNNLGMDVPFNMIHPSNYVKRVHINGDKAGSKNGWFIYHGGFGMLGDWKTGIRQIWKAVGQNITWKQTIDISAPSIDQLNAESKIKAKNIWNSAQKEDGSSHYLIQKGVKAFGLKTKNSRLIVPLHDENSDIHSLQFIKPTGEKTFLKGGKKKGMFFLIGKIEGKFLCVGEGYATCASVHEATGYPVAVAFDAGNLLAVGKILRQRYPEIRLIYCADNDLSGPTNTGLLRATEAAKSTSGFVVVPNELEQK